MNLEPQKPSEIRTDGGTVRVFASLAVMVLATLGIFLVLGLIPRDAFGEFAGKVGWIAVICLAVAAAVRFLSKPKS